MMELTAEQFAEIVGHLNGLASPDSSKDKRRATRIERRTRITITPVATANGATAANGAAGNGGTERPAAAGIVVMVKNLSSRGMALVTDREMVTGSQFMFRLARKDEVNGVPVDLLCTVVHCDEVADEVFSIGAEFTCIVGDGISNKAGGGDEAQRIRSTILE
jgi:hypothetical protein